MDIVNLNWITSHLPQVQEPLLEVGSYIVSGQEAIALRTGLWRLGITNYTGLDMREGPGVDIVCDASDMSKSIKDNSFKTVISLDAYEHMEWPQKVTREIFRVLEPGGYFFLATVFDFPIHDYPSDYWRFTPNCLKLLMEDAGFVDVSIEGGGDKPSIVRAIGRKPHETV